MNPSIRPTQPADMAAIRVFDQVGQRDSRRLAEIEAAIAQSQAWSIILGDEVVGYLILNREFFSRPFLALLYLAESCRGRGIGRWAIGWVIGHVAGPFFTSTNLSNARMIHLLRTSGFLDSGIVYHLDPGDPEIIFYHPGHCD